MAIDNTVLFVNGKGGVGKTTAASHLAAYAAAAGWDVLAIDADAQANQSRDLGYVPDGGEAFAAALRGTAPLVPTKHAARPSLDYVAGGPALDIAMDQLKTDLAAGRVGALRALERALAPVAGDYHLIVIDAPPRELLLRRLLLAAGRFLVVPCQVDDASVDGLANVLETVAEIRDTEQINPKLEVLGCFFMPVQNGAGKTVRIARDKITTLVGDESFVFDSTIRSAQAIAQHCRANGILSNEYEVIAQEAKDRSKRWFSMSREERAKARSEHSFSDAAPRLAKDWQDLTGEIMARFQERTAVAAKAAS